MMIPNGKIKHLPVTTNQKSLGLPLVSDKHVFLIFNDRWLFLHLGQSQYWSLDQSFRRNKMNQFLTWSTFNPTTNWFLLIQHYHVEKLCLTPNRSPLSGNLDTSSSESLPPNHQIEQWSPKFTSETLSRGGQETLRSLGPHFCKIIPVLSPLVYTTMEIHHFILAG